MNLPNEEELDTLLNWCVEAEERGRSHFPGLSYEEGVAAVIRWMRGEEPRPDSE